MTTHFFEIKRGHLWDSMRKCFYLHIFIFLLLFFCVWDNYSFGHKVIKKYIKKKYLKVTTHEHVTQISLKEIRCGAYAPDPRNVLTFFLPHLFASLGFVDCECVCVQWDIRSGEVVQEYDRHLGAVNTITFVDENRRFVSTSDDKSLRVWEWWGIITEIHI